MRKALIALGLGLAAAAAPASAVNLITNGGFETGDFTGWTLSVNQNATAINNANAQSGLYDARLRTTTTGGAAGARTISQFITTNVGYRYELSYWLRNQGNPNPVDSFEAVSGTTTTTFGDRGTFAYTQFLQQFIATSTSTQILFRYVHPQQGSFQLDTVSVEVVPEPGVWAMLVLGFGLVGVTMRRRGRAAIAA